jgi:hypothetical protein
VTNGLLEPSVRITALGPVPQKMDRKGSVPPRRNYATGLVGPAAEPLGLKGHDAG